MWAVAIQAEEVLGLRRCVEDEMFDAIVIGAGVLGLSAAFHLRQLRPDSRLIVLDQFHGPHARGSSHGETRVTRITYPSPAYVDLAKEAHARFWPELEAICSRSLWDQCSGLFAGEPSGPWDDFVRTTQGHVEVEPISWDVVSRRFPQFRSRDGSHALLDRSAGVIHAATVLEALRSACRERLIEFRENEPVHGIVLDGGHRPKVLFANEVLDADRIVVAAGPWSDRLVPLLRPIFRPVRQTIAYFDPVCRGGGPTDRAAYGPSRFPVWVHVGREVDDFFYGTPALEEGVIKVARHRTHGPATDPDQVGIADPAEIQAIQAFVARHFTFEAGPPIRAETCLYSMTPTEDFVIDVHPGSDRVVVGAGLSGHGFKFAPLLGRVLAELALDGATTVASYERHRDRFRFR